MSPGIKEETNGLSLPEAYKASLDQHIEQGGWSLVCRDEELCKHVEEILGGQGAQESYLNLTHGVDILSVMEESLCCHITVKAGLKGLAKAFEVLELASLNLYLYPWRKEYKVIKTYSGVFTHQVKPALSPVQVEELFGLLGYRVSLGNGVEEELRLGPSPALAEDLLQLACCFFIGRCECQLLLSALEPLRPTPPSSSSAAAAAAAAAAALPRGARSPASRLLPQVGSPGRGSAGATEWELRLVQERRRGNSLQGALQSVQRSLGAAAAAIAAASSSSSSSSSSSPNAVHPSSREVGCDSTEVDEDLYTGEEGDGNGPGGSPIDVAMPLQAQNHHHHHHHHQPPPPQHRPLKQVLSSPAVSTGAAASAAAALLVPPASSPSHSPSPSSPRCVSTFSYRLSSPSSPGGGVGGAGRGEPATARPLEEEQCPFQVTGSSGPSPGGGHDDDVGCACAKYGDQCNYMCHQCDMLHCLSCPVLDCCRDLDGHRVTYVSGASLSPEPSAVTEVKRVTSEKDKRPSSPPPHTWSQPPGFAERHSCLKPGDKPLLTCHTCRRAHDYLCEDGQRCTQADHQVAYHLEPSHSIPFHPCCTHSPPQFACLTCRVFHSASCPGGDTCRVLKHSTRELRGACEFSGCPSAPHILCKHCCAQFCRACWYKSPLTCLCGMPYDVCGSSV